MTAAAQKRHKTYRAKKDDGKSRHLFLPHGAPRFRGEKQRRGGVIRRIPRWTPFAAYRSSPVPPDPVHIAGRGGIHQDEPRHVDVVLGGVLLRRLVAAEATLVGHIGQEGLEDVGVVVPDEPLGVVRPLPVGVLRHHPQRLIGLVAPRSLVDLLDHVNELLGQVAHVLSLPFFQHGVEDGLKGFPLRRVGDLFGDTHCSAVLSFIESIGCFMCFFR